MAIAGGEWKGKLVAKGEEWRERLATAVKVDSKQWLAPGKRERERLSNSLSTFVTAQVKEGIASLILIKSEFNKNLGYNRIRLARPQQIKQ